MPNMQSAKKRLITSAKEKIRNKSRRTAIKTAEKKFRNAIEAADLDQAKEMMKLVFKTLDKAVKAGTIHKNKSSRKKSRFQKMISSVA
jgi:small subunit ribosomal protein S20